MSNRYDSRGMFWQDVYTARGKREFARGVPPVPDTGWTCPDEFPNLAAAKILCVDVETNDTGLSAGKGPGQYRGDGFVCGLAVGTEDGHGWYFPMRHERGPNMDPDKVLAWARDTLQDARPKIGANLKYDIEWLATEGVHLGGPVHDVQIAEPLIDETQRYYSLGYLADKYLGEGKSEALLYQWLADAFGGPSTRRAQAGRIWRAPAELVGPYAISDVTLPFRIWRKQKPLLEQQGLLDLYDMERALVPMLVAMRQYGIRVDTDRIPVVRDIMVEREGIAQRALNDMAGFEVNVNGNASLARAFDALGVAYNLTAKGNPSFPGKWLQAHPHPMAQAVVSVRKWGKARSTFIDGYMDYAIDGRIHAEFNQLKSDDSGTVARFSSSNPNLQNIPSRDDEMRSLVRSLYLPEEGCRYRRYDWSQIEFRLMVHYGRGPVADEARRMYNNDYTTDFHNMVVAMTGLPRKPAKNINFGLAYGMGEAKLASEMGMALDEAVPIFETYHEKFPFVKALFSHASNVAASRGYVKTLMGRRARFNLYEPMDWEMARHAAPLPYAQARAQWGRVRRAATHKGLSRVIQGGAADIMKKAMVDIWESGVCNVVGPPHLTVHDELGFSDPMTAESEQAFAEIKHIMEHCVDLRVPLLAECEVGPNWGELEAVDG